MLKTTARGPWKGKLSCATGQLRQLLGAARCRSHGIVVRGWRRHPRWLGLVLLIIARRNGAPRASHRASRYAGSRKSLARPCKPDNTKRARLGRARQVLGSMDQSRSRPRSYRSRVPAFAPRLVSFSDAQLRRILDCAPHVAGKIGTLFAPGREANFRHAVGSRYLAGD